MRRHTHRELKVWLEYLKEQYNQPDRTDHYLMQLAAEVRRGNVKHPKEVKAEDFKITFKFRDPDPNAQNTPGSKTGPRTSSQRAPATQLQRTQATIYAKLKWGAFLASHGVKPKELVPSPPTPPVAVTPTVGG